jgi:hypothetical protein
MLIDLQVHSTYSDGYLTPTGLVRFLKKQGVKTASLTDHNTVGGLDEFAQAAKKANIKPINGLEIYARLNSTCFNLLWYGFDEKSPDLHNLLRDSQVRRRRQVRRALHRLEKLGFEIETEKLLDKFNHYIPINHIVDEFLAEPGNQKRVRQELRTRVIREGDVINHYFRNKEIGVLNETYIDVDKVVKLRKKIGGKLILNHPGKHGRIRLRLWDKLMKLGFDGVEVLSPHHSYGAVMYMQALARKYDFVETGGSDFHRFEGDNYPLQCSWDYFQIDSDHLRSIKEIIG